MEEKQRFVSLADRGRFTFAELGGTDRRSVLQSEESRNWKPQRLRAKAT